MGTVPGSNALVNGERTSTPPLNGRDPAQCLLTAGEVAELLGVPRSWVYEQSRRGRKVARAPDHYELFDHLRTSPALASQISTPTIHRRGSWTRDGSDHDPVSVTARLA